MPVGTVARDKTSILQQRGWKLEDKNTFTGPYATPYGTWHGWVHRAGDRSRVMIHNPPMEVINKHPKRGCFHPAENGWWAINLHTEPVDGDVSSIITYVEQVIRESFRLG